MTALWINQKTRKIIHATLYSGHPIFGGSLEVLLWKESILKNDLTSAIAQEWDFWSFV